MALDQAVQVVLAAPLAYCQPELAIRLVDDHADDPGVGSQPAPVVLPSADLGLVHLDNDTWAADF